MADSGPEGNDAGHGNPMDIDTMLNGSTDRVKESSSNDTPTTCVALSDSGDMLATGSDDAIVRVYRVDKALGNLELVKTLEAHFGGINDIAWSPDGKTVASASDDKLVMVWNVQSGKPLRVFRGHTHAVTSVRFNFKGNLVVSASVDEDVRIWDIRGEQCIRTFAAHSEAVTVADFSYDNTLVVSGAYDGMIRLWDIQSGHCLRTLAAGGPGGKVPVSYLGFTPNAQYVLVRTIDGHVRLWDYLSRQCVKDYYEDTKDLFSRPFKFAGQSLILATATGAAIWDFQSSKLEFALDFPGGALALDYHASNNGHENTDDVDSDGSRPDGAILVLAGPAGVKLYKSSDLPDNINRLLFKETASAPLPSQQVRGS